MEVLGVGGVSWNEMKFGLEGDSVLEYDTKIRLWWAYGRTQA
jgi:hypothetical protein